MTLETKLYYRGAPGAETIFYAKFAALASYWALCVYSLAMHLYEPAWIGGSAGPLLLTSNFMSAWYQQFSVLFESSEIAVAMAKGALWIMMLWYPVVLPFVLIGGWFRRYVIVWGWLFFAFSLFIMQLGYLAEIEILFWLALFWSFAGLERKRPLQVLYDDRCNLCDKTVTVITFLDIFGRITLRPLSSNKLLLNEMNIDPDQALTDLYGVHDHTLYKGYEFYIQLCRSLVLLWPFLPVLLLARFLRIGPMIYRFIALRRVRLFGVCEVQSIKFSHATGIENSQSQFPRVISLHIIFLCFLYLISIPSSSTPDVKRQGLSRLIVSGTALGARAAHIYGIAPINVFNHVDLRMAENWFTLNSSDFDELVPIIAEDGSRLSMHASDRIYFGHTLRFRRKVIDQENICHFEKNQPVFDYLSKVYLQKRRVDAGTYEFIYRQFYSPLADPNQIERNLYRLNPVKEICKVNYSVVYE